MPAKNTLKKYISEGYYHIYNRGVEKRNIFLDDQDRLVFLNYLKEYLLPKEEIIESLNHQDMTDLQKAQRIIEFNKINNFYGRINMACFVLMDNHFHMELKQKEDRDIEMFMRSLNTKYGRYFNKRYKRVGPLFQSRYKGILIKNEKYFLHLSRYIHQNSKELIGKNQPLSSYKWSSYRDYLGQNNFPWLKKNLLLDYFKKAKGFGFSSYQGFVEGYEDTSEDVRSYKDLILE